MSSSVGILVLVLAVVLVIPLVCRKIHVPSIVGFILTGMLLGPSALGWLNTTPTISLIGKLGILYIMFQVGIEIDRNNFHQQRGKGVFFGLLSFMFPSILGTAVGLLFGWSIRSSLLLGAMLGSHTLMTYPIVSRYGIQKTPAVNIVVGGTMLAITLSLLVLALVKPVADPEAWYITLGKVAVMLLTILWLFPRLCQWVFKRWQDAATDFTLVMTILMLSAFLADWAGLDAILGAFICGVALNGRVPNNSPLMKRINFIGNTIFVPVFLLSVGLMIDVHAFWQSGLTWAIAGTMIGCKLIGKWLAAWTTQRSFGMSAIERQLMFGLTHATAAGTLAIVTIGFRTGLFSADILNGAIIMILVLCTLASFATEYAAKVIALQEEAKLESDRTENEWLFISVDDEPSYLNRLAELSQLNNVELVECADWQDTRQTIERSSKSAIVYKERQPLNTINRLLVAVPKYAEKEHDFISCFGLIRRLSGQIGAKVTFYACPESQQALRSFCRREGKYLRASYRELNEWNDVLRIARDIASDDLAVFISARSSTPSYNPLFDQNPIILRNFFTDNSYLILYPEQQIGAEAHDFVLMDIPQASSTWRIVTTVKNAIQQVLRKLTPRR